MVEKSPGPARIITRVPPLLSELPHLHILAVWGAVSSCGQSRHVFVLGSSESRKRVVASGAQLLPTLVGQGIPGRCEPGQAGFLRAQHSE